MGQSCWTEPFNLWIGLDGSQLMLESENWYQRYGKRCPADTQSGKARRSAQLSPVLQMKTNSRDCSAPHQAGVWEEARNSRLLLVLFRSSLKLLSVWRKELIFSSIRFYLLNLIAYVISSFLVLKETACLFSYCLFKVILLTKVSSNRQLKKCKGFFFFFAWFSSIFKK